MQAKPSITPFNLRESNLDELEYFSFFYLAIAFTEFDTFCLLFYRKLMKYTYHVVQ